MNRYVIDIESTFSKENTLTTKSIEAYVRDPKFEIIGGSIKCLASGKTTWHSKLLPDILDQLADNSAFICHHAQFDLFALNHVYGIKPKFIFDTLSMSRAIYPRWKKHSLEACIEHLGLGQPKSVPYNHFRGKTLAELEGHTTLLQAIAHGCCHDVEMTAKLFAALEPQMPASELELIDATVRMFTEPTLVGDVETLEDALTEAIYERDVLPERIGVTKEVLLSDRKFASLLHGAGAEPPTKTSPRTGKQTYALAKSDAAFTNLKEHPNPYVRDIVSARLAVKTSIGETRAARLLGAATRGPIPVYLRYYGAHTGRLSGGDRVNLQNIKRGSKIRAGLCAPSGHVLVWADFSQIEARILACLSGCAKLRDAFSDGRDVYSEFGTELFGTEVSKTVRPELRYVSKKDVLGSGYGLGPEKFMATVNADAENDPKLKGFKIDLEMATLAVKGYRQTYPEIPALWRLLNHVLGHLLHSRMRPRDEYMVGPVQVVGQCLILPNGMTLDYTGLQYNAGTEDRAIAELLGHPVSYPSYRLDGQKLWGGVLTENIVQALARIIATDAWLELKRHGYPVIHMEHDMLMCCVTKSQGIEAKYIMEEFMTLPKSWMPDLPLAVEVHLGDNYGVVG